MNHIKIQKRWAKSFERIKNNKLFIEFYCEAEDNWLQYSDWAPKIHGVFGSYENAVLAFRTYLKENKR